MELNIKVKSEDEMFAQHELNAIKLLVRSFLKEEFDIDTVVNVSCDSNPNMPFFTYEFVDHTDKVTDFRLWSTLYDLMMQFQFSANTASGLKFDSVMFIPSWPSDMIGRFYDQIHSLISAALPNITINIIQLVPVTQDEAGMALFTVYSSDDSDETKDKIQATQSQLQILFRGLYGTFK